MIYADFESILVPEDNVKQNPNESYGRKYQKHVACHYGYKLIISLVSFLSHIKVKMVFTTLLLV